MNKNKNIKNTEDELGLDQGNLGHLLWHNFR
jgi:hypothetical protein